MSLLELRALQPKYSRTSLYNECITKHKELEKSKEEALNLFEKIKRESQLPYAVLPNKKKEYKDKISTTIINLNNNYFYLINDLVSKYLQLNHSEIKSLRASQIFFPIVVKDLNGFGDLIHAIKFQELLLEKYPNSDSLIILKNNETLEKIALISQSINNIIVIDQLSKELEKPKYKKYKKAIIFGSASIFKVNDKFYIKTINIFQQNTNIEIVSRIIIREYSIINYYHDFERKANDSIYSTGLRENELGIFTKQKLCGISSDNSIQKMIKTESIYSFFPNIKISGFKENYAFYLAYAHKIKSHCNFVQIALKLGENTGKDIFAIFIIANRIQSTFLDYIKENPLLKNTNINKIVEEQKKNQNIPLSIEGKLHSKNIKLILVNKVQHSDMNLFTYLSCCSLITGDMSFSEALSSESIIFYEILQHKANFYKSFENIAQQNNKYKLVADFFSAISSIFLYRGRQPYITDEETQAITNIMNNSKFIENWKQFIQKIKNEYSIEKKAIKAIDETIFALEHPKYQTIFNLFFKIIDIDRKLIEELALKEKGLFPETTI